MVAPAPGHDSASSHTSDGCGGRTVLHMSPSGDSSACAGAVMKASCVLCPLSFLVCSSSEMRTLSHRKVKVQWPARGRVGI